MRILLLTFTLYVASQCAFSQTVSPPRTECDYPCGPSGGTWQAVENDVVIIQGACTTKVKIEKLDCENPVGVHSIRIKSISSNCYDSPLDKMNEIVQTWAGNFLPGYSSYFKDILNSDTSKVVRLVFPSCMRVCYNPRAGIPNNLELAQKPGMDMPQTVTAIDKFVISACGFQCCVYEFKVKLYKCDWIINKTNARSYLNDCARIPFVSCPPGYSYYPTSEFYECVYVCD